MIEPPRKLILDTILNSANLSPVSTYSLTAGGKILTRQWQEFDPILQFPSFDVREQREASLLCQQWTMCR
jgi:hypothetical protein